MEYPLKSYLETKIEEFNLVGRRIMDVFMTKDEPWLDKSNYLTLYVNHYRPDYLPKTIRSVDIEDDLSVTRGCGTDGEVFVLFEDGDAFGIHLYYDLCEVRLFTPVSGEIRHKELNIDEHRLFSPVFDEQITEYNVRSKIDHFGEELNLYLKLTSGRMLHIGWNYMTILENDGSPMQITMGEEKLMIRDYESYFDDELVFTDKKLEWDAWEIGL